MDDTMTRLLAGEALTPMEAAVFGAEFARRFERRRYACEPDDDPGEMDLRLACDAVDALNAALAEEPMPHLALLGPSPSPLIRKSAEKGVWCGVNWLVEAGRDGDGVKLMIWCPYRPEGEPIAAVHDVTTWRTGDAQRVAEDLLHAALRRAVAARQSGADNAKEPDHG